MSNYESISAAQYDILTEIPSNQQIIFGSFKDPWRVLRRKLSTMEEDVTRDFLIAVTHCPPSSWLEIAEKISRMRPGTHTHRLSYDADARLGIVKCMPRPEHGMIIRLLEFHIMTLARQYVYPIGSATFTNRNDSNKEPDASYMAKTRSDDEWPGLVVEVGYTQSESSLRQSARWWLESRPRIVTPVVVIHGVSQVLLLRIIRQQHIIIIESWVLGGAPPRSTRNLGNRPGLATLQQAPTILTRTFNNNTNSYSTTIQGPATIPILWEAIHDTPRPAGQGNYILTKTMLHELGDDIWCRIR